MKHTILFAKTNSFSFWEERKVFASEEPADWDKLYKKIDELSLDQLRAKMSNPKEEESFNDLTPASVAESSGNIASQISILGGIDLNSRSGGNHNQRPWEKPGQRLDSTRAIQQILIDRKFLSGKGSESADGKYGLRTKKAVMQLQRSLGIAADGKFGNGTLAALGGNPGVETSRSSEYLLPTSARIAQLRTRIEQSNIPETARALLAKAKPGSDDYVQLEQTLRQTRGVEAFGLEAGELLDFLVQEARSSRSSLARQAQGESVVVTRQELRDRFPQFVLDAAIAKARQTGQSHNITVGGENFALSGNATSLEIQQKVEEIAKKTSRTAQSRENQSTPFMSDFYGSGASSERTGKSVSSADIWKEILDQLEQISGVKQEADANYYIPLLHTIDDFSKTLVENPGLSESDLSTIRRELGSRAKRSSEKSLTGSFIDFRSLRGVQVLKEGGQYYYIPQALNGSYYDRFLRLSASELGHVAGGKVVEKGDTRIALVRNFIGGERILLALPSFSGSLARNTGIDGDFRIATGVPVSQDRAREIFQKIDRAQMSNYFQLTADGQIVLTGNPPQSAFDSEWKGGLDRDVDGHLDSAQRPHHNRGLRFFGVTEGASAERTESAGAEYSDAFGMSELFQGQALTEVERSIGEANTTKFVKKLTQEGHELFEKSKDIPEIAGLFRKYRKLKYEQEHGGKSFNANMPGVSANKNLQEKMDALALTAKMRTLLDVSGADGVSDFASVLARYATTGEIIRGASSPETSGTSSDSPVSAAGAEVLSSFDRIRAKNPHFVSQGNWRFQTNIGLTRENRARVPQGYKRVVDAFDGATTVTRELISSTSKPIFYKLLEVGPTKVIGRSAEETRRLIETRLGEISSSPRDPVVKVENTGKVIITTTITTTDYSQDTTETFEISQDGTITYQRGDKYVTVYQQDDEYIITTTTEKNQVVEVVKFKKKKQDLPWTIEFVAKNTLFEGDHGAFSGAIDLGVGAIAHGIRGKGLQGVEGFLTVGAGGGVQLTDSTGVAASVGGRLGGRGVEGLDHSVSITQSLGDRLRASFGFSQSGVSSFDQLLGRDKFQRNLRLDANLSETWDAYVQGWENIGRGGRGYGMGINRSPGNIQRLVTSAIENQSRDQMITVIKATHGEQYWNSLSSQQQEVLVKMTQDTFAEMAINKEFRGKFMGAGVSWGKTHVSNFVSLFLNFSLGANVIRHVRARDATPEEVALENELAQMGKGMLSDRLAEDRTITPNSNFTYPLFTDKDLPRGSFMNKRQQMRIECFVSPQYQGMVEISNGTPPTFRYLAANRMDPQRDFARYPRPKIIAENAGGHLRYMVYFGDFMNARYESQKKWVLPWGDSASKPFQEVPINEEVRTARPRTESLRVSEGVPENFKRAQQEVVQWYNEDRANFQQVWEILQIQMSGKSRGQKIAAAKSVVGVRSDEELAEIFGDVKDWVGQKSQYFRQQYGLSYSEFVTLMTDTLLQRSAVNKSDVQKKYNWARQQSANWNTMKGNIAQYYGFSAGGIPALKNPSRLNKSELQRGNPSAFGGLDAALMLTAGNTWAAMPMGFATIHHAEIATVRGKNGQSYEIIVGYYDRCMNPMIAIRPAGGDSIRRMTANPRSERTGAQIIKMGFAIGMTRVNPTYEKFVSYQTERLPDDVHRNTERTTSSYEGDPFTITKEWTEETHGAREDRKTTTRNWTDSSTDVNTTVITIPEPTQPPRPEEPKPTPVPVPTQPPTPKPTPVPVPTQPPTPKPTPVPTQPPTPKPKPTPIQGPAESTRPPNPFLSSSDWG